MTARRLIGKVIEAANGHLSYEVFDVSSEMVSVAAKLLEEKFGLQPITDPAVGLSEVALNVRNPEVRLGLGWDLWSGLYVTAYDEAGDAYIERIADYLNREFHHPDYDRYITT